MLSNAQYTNTRVTMLRGRFTRQIWLNVRSMVCTNISEVIIIMVMPMAVRRLAWSRNWKI